MKYRFKALEWNGLKGTIGEHLARSFIRTVLAPRLAQEEGWDHVVLSHNDYKHQAKKPSQKLFKFDRYREDFMGHGVYATSRLLARYADAVGTLLKNHCTPDGLLLKLRETGSVTRLKARACPLGTLSRVAASQRHGDRVELPVVDGALEIVEIKCGRAAKLVGKQKSAYNDLIAKDVPLRMIKVRIVSFDLNRFLVEDHRYDRFL